MSPANVTAQSPRRSISLGYPISTILALNRASLPPMDMVTSVVFSSTKPRSSWDTSLCIPSPSCPSESVGLSSPAEWNGRTCRVRAPLHASRW
ncbi:hypothetical protein [Saccharothrix lopnurensis]|uniref:Uncharacterized protein n=1 Tax=Saccharothrix lopnurensis TaxID=1670621 RepID=A0ABW1PH03_9PSEU